MKRLCIVSCWVLWLWTACLPSAAAENQPPAEGGTLPAIRVSAPKDAEQQSYLGVTGRKDFTVSEIAAEVIIIEIFSMY